MTRSTRARAASSATARRATASSWTSSPPSEIAANENPPARFSIAVGSGKGGVGKSTISLNLALALREAGASVGLLDADVFGPDIPLMVNLKRRETAKYWTMYSAKRHVIEPVEEHGLKIMSSGFVIGEDTPLTWVSNLIDRMVWQFVYETAWGDLDYLVIDLPPGTADLQQGLMQKLPLAGAIVVVTPQDVAHLDGRKAVEMYRNAGVRVLGGVENMAGLACPHCGVRVEVLPRVREERSIWAMGVDRLGSIPMDPAVAQAGDRGRPIVVWEPGSVPAQAFRFIAGEVVAALA